MEQIKNTLKSMNSKHPVWGILLILAGLAIGWLAWGGPLPMMDRMHDDDVSVEEMHHEGAMDEGMVASEEMGMEETMDAMTAGLAGKEGRAFDEAFLDEMIAHHEGAIAMAKLVLEKSDKPELLKLAGEIIYAQSKEIEMMKEWKEKWF